MTELIHAGDFLAKARRRMRFGTFSREPLRLLRLEWKERCVECDWLMRAADPWDRFIPDRVAEEHQTLQALRDAMNLRDVVFESFPEVTSAKLQMFRTGRAEKLELVLMGSVSRLNEVLRNVPSVAMRAKMCGFQFNLAKGALESINPISVGCV